MANFYFQSSSCFLKAEIKQKITLKVHFLFIEKTETYIYGYAITYFQNGFILFGGWTSSTSNSKTIARLDLATTTWSKLGDLKTGREGHGVIYDGQVFLVVGGYGNRKTEKCTLSGMEL